MNLIFKIFFLSMYFPLAYSDQKKLFIMDSQSIEPYKTVKEAMLQEIQNLGYQEMKNISIDYSNLGNFEGRGVNELKLREKIPPDVVFVNGTIAALAMKQYLSQKKEIPFKIIFANIPDSINLSEKEYIVSYKLHPKEAGQKSAFIITEIFKGKEIKDIILHLN